MDVMILGEWYESVRGLPDRDRLAWFDGIFRYANDGTLPAAGDVWGNIGVGMARRMIDERARKSRAGKSGGRPRKADGKADGKAETETAKADGKHKEGKEGKNEGMNERDSARAPSFDMVKSHVAVHFCPPPPDDFVADWYRRMGEGGWKDRNGHDLAARGRWQRELSVWWTREKEKNSAARASIQARPMLIGANGVPLNPDGEQGPELI